MKCVLALGIGFIIGRQVYINLNKMEALKKEKRAKEKLHQLLEENGFSLREAEDRAKEILGS